MTAPATIHHINLGQVEYQITDALVVSKWPDGLETIGLYNISDEDEARARALGYQGNRSQACTLMHQDHDLAHHLVAQALGWPHSIVLRLAAEGKTTFPTGIYQTEERMALLTQRAANLGSIRELAEADQ